MLNKEYLMEKVREQLSKIGIKDAVLINEIQMKAQGEDEEELLSSLNELKKKHPTLDLTPILNYIKATKASMVDARNIGKYEVGSEVLVGVVPILEKLSKSENRLILLSMDLELSYEQVKKAIRQILPEHFNISTRRSPEEIVLPFIITKEKTIEGQVLSNLDSGKKSITLVSAYVVGSNYVYQFFGETKPTEVKRSSPVARYSAPFYLYKFQTNTNEEIILFSQKELKIETCRIIGMEVSCFDYLKIGNMARINMNQRILFVHTQEPSIDMIDEKKFWQLAEQFEGHDSLAKAYFGLYRHPKWFEAFIISWSFSGKVGNMPTHISLMSPPAQGKSFMLEGLGRVFGQEIQGGGTVKGLAPSFANGVPKEGYLIRCKRFAFVDEFIHILQNSAKSLVDFDSGSYQLLKVLEHSENEFSSAYGTIKARPKMWCLFCSNIRPSEHIKNLVDLHEKLNVAFMSRLLWYVYNEEHINFINRNKLQTISYGEEAKPKYNPSLCSMVDFLHSFTLQLPIEKIEEIYKKYKELVPDSLQTDIYDSRMLHHIYRMADGYVKYKSVIEQRGKFICLPQDLNEIDEMFRIIISSWSYNLDYKYLTPAMKKAYLNTIEREIFDFIERNQTQTVAGGVDEITLTKAKGEVAREYAEKMVRDGLLKVVVGSCRTYYTYNGI